MFCEERGNARPSVLRGFGLVNAGVAVAEEGVPLIGVNDHLVFHADVVEQFVKFFHRASGDGNVRVAEEAESRRVQFLAQLIEENLHSAAVKRADRVHWALNA